DRAAGREHNVLHPSEVIVKDGNYLFRLALLGEARVAAQVGHQNRHVTLLTAETEPVRRREQRLRDLGRDVTAERVPDPFALAQALDHLVEGARQPADLVARADGDALRQVTGRDASGGAGQRDDR